MPAWLRILGILLFPFIALYTLLVFIRNKLYDRGWLAGCESVRPVISIGNIQLGGTGKTPMVEFLVKELQDRNYDPAILTRGYGRQVREQVVVDRGSRNHLTIEQLGDEPFLLSMNLPDTTIIVNPARCAAARFLEHHFSSKFAVLDDGFQHRRIKRDLDIVMIDVVRWSSCPFLFPLTFKRDVTSSLKRADVFILTRTETESEKAIHLQKMFSERYGKPVFTARNKLEQLSASDESHILAPDTWKGTRVLAFCGLGHPAQFFDMLERNGFVLAQRRGFPDHHQYKSDEISAMVKEAEILQAQYIITSQKDNVKLLTMEPGIRSKVYFTGTRLVIEDSINFLELVEKKISDNGKLKMF